jgi:integrase
VGALELHDEWKRLKREGGHHRKTGEKRPLSAKSVRNIAGVVSSACAWAILYGLIRHNPVTDSKPPTGKGRRGIALAAPQVQLMAATATGQWAEFIEVEDGLGIRRGEALALRWSDIVDGITVGKPDADKVAIIARSLGQVKGNLYFKDCKTPDSVRKIEIPAYTLAALERQRAEQAKARAVFPDYDVAGDLIFANPDGSPLKPDSVSSKISLLCRNLKLPKGASLHTLRHSHGSTLIADGQDIAAVSKRLGHANPATTLGIYTHEVPGGKSLAEAYDRLHGKKPQ